MRYRDKKYSDRFGTMGDPAENVYAQVKPFGRTTRFGWRRPKGIVFKVLPQTLRHMPDYYAEAGFAVEVVGLGRDGILKSLKVKKYEALKKWKKFFAADDIELKLFVWNSHTQEWCVIGWESLVKLVAKAKRTHGIRSFENDGNEYYPIEWGWLLDEAEVSANYEE